MKIVHIADCYIDGWGYQENLLPQYQKRDGHSVVVVADNDHLKYLNNPKLAQEILMRGVEYDYDGIKVYKIREYLTTSSSSLVCKGLNRILKQESPDMIFHHNLNLSTLSVAARYKRKHPEVKLYVDNHADWINESKNWLWHLFFYDIMMPLHVKSLGDYVDAYIGVSPLRCQYLNKVFRVPKRKIVFLPIGCDTYQAKQIMEDRLQLRKQYGISEQSFLIISGGKIDRSKGTIELISACEEIKKKGEDIHLVLFGKIDDEVGGLAQKYDWISIFGWCDRKKTLSLLKMADTACWPWLHTTLIEDSVAVGTPLVVKMSDNVSHFCKEDAGVFMKCGDKKELEASLQKMKGELATYRKNAQIASDKYSYAALAKMLDEGRFCELEK